MLVKYLKNIRFWLVFLPISYAILGFFLFPWLALTQIPTFLKKHFDIVMRVEKITFNPFTFELHVNNLSLLDTKNDKVIDIRHFYINYEPSHLFQKEVFIQSLVIEQPSVDMQINAEGTFNLTQLFPITEEDNSTQNNDASLPIFIKQIDIKNALASFQDFRPKEPFSLNLGPINYTINNLGFKKDMLSIHALKMMLDNEEKVSLASSATMEPLKFYGELNLKNIYLPLFWPYAMQDTKVKLSKGDISVHLPFLIDLSKEIPLFSINNATLELNSVIFDDENKTNIITIPNLKVDDIDFEWPKAQLSIDKIAISKPFIDIQLEKNYTLNLVSLFLPSTPESNHSVQSDTNQSYPSLNFELKTLNIDDANIHILDTNIKNSSKAKLSSLYVTSKNITTDTTKAISYDLASTIDESSQLKIQGTFIPSTLSIESNIDANALAISKIQPYLGSFTTLSIKDGLLTLKGKLKASFEAQKEPFIKLDTNLDISKFVLNDIFNKPIIAWDKLFIDSISYVSTPSSLHVNAITFDKPYVNLDIKKDKSTNFTNIFKPSPPQSKAKSKNDDAEIEIVLGAMTLKQGSANFKDASLPIPFATFINNLNGTCSTLDTKNTKPSILSLEGKVDKYGYTKIGGSLLPFDFKDRANLEILFKNIDMPSLTPYSEKFIGYAIKKGKLSMDLSYKIKKGMMEGKNKINLDSLTLGDKIESDEATNLPLGLAISILKDSKGQIDLDLPVSGDLNDPDFKYGSTVWKAFGNLIGGIIASPFKLLGSLLGIETETLKSVDFESGEALLIASEEEKMELYRQILAKKSELKLIITPSYNEEIDIFALREKAVTQQIELIIQKNPKEENSYGKAIKNIFIAKFSQDVYQKLMKSYQEEKLDRGAINENLKSKLANAITITPNELETLAENRAREIIKILTTKYNVSPQRVLKGELQTSDTMREKWVGCKVTVSN